MNSKVFYAVLLFLGAVAVAVADRQPTYSYNPPQESYEYSAESAEAKYDFNWAVNDAYSGNNFGHQESRDGDQTQGSYYVQLPDGRLQKVSYYVDGDSGFVADVSYEGEAQYPESAESREYSAPTPSYSAPRPSYSAPRPAPRPSYSAPRPAPRPTYSAPESEESVEVPVYTPPRRSYGFPQ